ncbi:glycoside hydrolase family 113 [Flavobacteriaceae bacterium M23B6Z8]
MYKLKYFFVLLSLFFVQLSCTQNTKVNGLSYVASRNEISLDDIKSLKDANANWAAVMPFGFMKSVSTPQIIYDTDWQWWGERQEGAEVTTSYLHEKGLKVMIKPQIWVNKGAFTGTIKMMNEQDWVAFEKSYAEFLLTYARMAERMNAEVLCIGTELYRFIENRPEYWTKLIRQIREVYSGKLTYAENWDSFSKVPFWSQLDYIGIDAYFPLSDAKTPSIEELRSGWEKHKKSIFKVHKTHEKPIMFTEYGYRSVDYTAKEPWNFNHKANKNMKAQQNALKALYDEFWHEPWFVGGFLWKWFDNHKQAGGLEDNQFTPQNKPAESLISDFYKSAYE